MDDEKINGRGAKTTAQGTYVGEFKDGKYNGNGTYYAPNGAIIREGVYKNGSYISPAPSIQSTVVTQDPNPQKQPQVIN
jgi:hypothetical protein